MVEIGGTLHLSCMPHDYWATGGNYWYIYLTVVSVACRVYVPGGSSWKHSVSGCSDPTYDISRFRAHRQWYVLMLDVENVTHTDAGLYVCAQPAVHHNVGYLGLVAVVGVVREYGAQTHN